MAVEGIFPLLAAGVPRVPHPVFLVDGSPICRDHDGHPLGGGAADDLRRPAGVGRGGALVPLTRYQEEVARRLGHSHRSADHPLQQRSRLLPRLRGARRDRERTKIEWAHDSAWRFMPTVRHPLAGYVLHPVDLAVNKLLALAGRDEARDFLDVLDLDRRTLALGALCWAAAGKDPGSFRPEAAVANGARRRGRRAAFRTAGRGVATHRRRRCVSGAPAPACRLAGPHELESSTCAPTRRVAR